MGRKIRYVSHLEEPSNEGSGFLRSKVYAPEIDSL